MPYQRCRSVMSYVFSIVWCFSALQASSALLPFFCYCLIYVGIFRYILIHVNIFHYISTYVPGLETIIKRCGVKHTAERWSRFLRRPSGCQNMTVLVRWGTDPGVLRVSIITPHNHVYVCEGKSAQWRIRPRSLFCHDFNTVIYYIISRRHTKLVRGYCPQQNII